MDRVLRKVLTAYAALQDFLDASSGEHEFPVAPEVDFERLRSGVRWLLGLFDSELGLAAFRQVQTRSNRWTSCETR